MRLPSIAALLALVFSLGACASNPTSKTSASSSRRTLAACLDTLQAADSISTVVKMSVQSIDSAVALPSDFEGLLVDEFRRAFRAPSRLPLSVVMGTPPCDSLGGRCAGGELNVSTVAYATAHGDGKLSDIAVIDASLTPALADSVASALKTVSNLGASPPTGEVQSIHVMMQIGPEENPDTVPALRRILVAKVPHYELPFRYATMPAAGVNPSYPFAARLAGLGDSVTLAFTVEPNGTIAGESMELVQATYRDFISSVLDALGTTRFHPAYLGDCPVATRMTQRFMFKTPN